jgi:hypothetical protein
VDVVLNVLLFSHQFFIPKVGADYLAYRAYGIFAGFAVRCSFDFVNPKDSLMVLHVASGGRVKAYRFFVFLECAELLRFICF